MMDLGAVRDRGYDLDPAPLDVRSFQNATKVGDLIFTSGQLPINGGREVRGKVGADVDVELAREAAALCAVNCLRAALTVAAPDEIVRAVKLVGLVNVAPGFEDTSAVIDGATDLLNAVFTDVPSHARSAIGVHLPGGWAVEVELILECGRS